MSSKIQIIEVGPRDGLQNENQILSAKIKSNLVKKLTQAGIKRIEVGAFVSPKWVPQMEDTLKVAKSTKKLKTKFPNQSYSALVPNLRGLDDFLKADLDEVSLFTACTEAFAHKNINCSIKESFERFKPVIKECRSKKIKVRGYLSTVFGCPFEGKVPISRVVKHTHSLFALGVHEVSLGDTIGVATPLQIKKVMSALIKSGINPVKLAGHYHNTRGTALSNVITSLDFEVKKFDSCVGGLGGCPYAPGAAGNLATEDLVYTFEQMGLKTGIDLKQLIEIARWLQTQIGHPIASHVAMSGGWNV